MEVPEPTPQVPKDPYRLVYIIIYWLGIGTLMPWNFFIAVNGYWMFKFRDTNITSEDNSTKLSDLQLKWGPFLSMAAMIPNVSILLVNAIFGHRFSIKPLLITSMSLIIGIFIFSDVMTQIDTDSWQVAFMVITLITVALFNAMVAFLQGGLTGTMGRFPSEYMGALVQGQALGGIIAVGTNVVMLTLGLDDVSAAFYDFLVAVVYLATALIAFIAVTKTEFYTYFADGQVDTKSLPRKESDHLLDASAIAQATSRKKTANILKVGIKIWPWLSSIFVCFLCTLSVFPSITQLAFSTAQESEWSKTYFIPVGCFLLFNLGDFFGRILASWVKWPGPSKTGGLLALLISILRLLFIPLFLICNISPENREVTSVVFKSDTVYLGLMILFSLSNGYMGNICLSFAPKILTDPTEQGQAASLVVFFLVFGLAIGSAISTLCISLL